MFYESRPCVLILYLLTDEFDQLTSKMITEVLNPTQCTGILAFF